MRIRAVIWDIGGVLVRTEDRQPRQQMAAELGLSYTQLDNLVFNSESGQKSQIGQVSTLDHWKWVAKTLGKPEAQIPMLQTEFFAGDRLDSVLIDEIYSLHKRYLCGIITNATDNARSLIAKTWQIKDAFDHIVVSAEVGIVKPDAEIYRLSLLGLGVTAREAVFIDDFLHNVEGAQEVGMHAIHFKNSEQALRELQSLFAENR